MWQRDERRQYSGHRNMADNYGRSSERGFVDRDERTYDGRTNSFERFHKPESARESNQRNKFQDKSMSSSTSETTFVPFCSPKSMAPSNFPPQNNAPPNYLVPNMTPSIPYQNFGIPNMEQSDMGPPKMPQQNIAPPIMAKQNFGMPATMEQKNFGSSNIPHHNLPPSNMHPQNIGPTNMQHQIFSPRNISNQNMVPPKFSEQNMEPPNMIPPMFINVPPPGFTNASIPPPGFPNTNAPPDFLKSQMPPPNGRLMGGNIPPPGSVPPPMGASLNSSMVLQFSPHAMVNQDVLPMHLVNQQGLIQGDDSMCVNNDDMTRTLDQQWVNTFLDERKLSEKTKKEKPKVGEAKEMLQKWFRVIGKVEAQRDHLTECIKCGDSEWQRELQKANLLTEELEQVEAEFSSQYDIDGLLKEVEKKKKKREWQKRRRKTLALEKQETERKRYELHLQIDQWREKEIAKDKAKFKDASIKKEAGGVLGEVRVKQGESSRSIGLLQALKKLRSFRKQEAEVKGVYQRPSIEQTKDFEQRIEFLEKLMNKHQELYESEEKTLSVMLAEEEEEKERERREKKHTKQLEEAAAASDSTDPMREFYRYYTQAENGLDSLIHIRHGWDMYIVPDAVLGASSIPPRNVSPCAPTSNKWSTYLKDDG